MTKAKSKKQKKEKKPITLWWRILRNLALTLVAGALILGIIWGLSIVGEYIVQGIQWFWKSYGAGLLISSLFWIPLFSAVTIVTEKFEKKKSSDDEDDDDEDDDDDDDKKKGGKGI